MCVLVIACHLDALGEYDPSIQFPSVFQSSQYAESDFNFFSNIPYIAVQLSQIFAPISINIKVD